MKSKYMTVVLAVLLAIAFVGCEDNDVIVAPVDVVPAAPQGVFSITGDRMVYLYWNGPYESDIVQYIIWRSLEPVHNYREIGRRA
ncbi:MAG: hypothetical protein AB1744_16300, partial [Candidatus Zixiibacteriota bacterium]